jgi:hypothetical protein
VQRFFKSEVGAAIIWVLNSMVFAAVISPWMYQGGKQLALLAASKDLPALLEWLGAACGRATISRYYARSLLLCALVLLPLLLRRIHALRSSEGIGGMHDWNRVSRRDVVLQIAIGCIISGGMLWGLGAILEWIGAYVPKAIRPGPGILFSKVLIPVVSVSLIEEWLFRGLLLGLWLRYARPVVACLGSSLLFAFLHFLNSPDGMRIADPSHAFAGFQLLGQILMHFTDPLFFITDFATLSVVGLILAWARIRTGALWFPIGLHAGWILVFKGFNLMYQSVPDHFLRPWGVGESLRSGMLPMCTLGLTAVICHFAQRRFERRSVSLASR